MHKSKPLSEYHIPIKSQVANTIKLKILNCTSSNLEAILNEWLGDALLWKVVEDKVHISLNVYWE